jgi:RimJ/RimL family protein N-acetyltransferase
VADAQPATEAPAEETARPIPQYPILRGRLVYLRPLEMADVPMYAAWRNDLDAMLTAGWGRRGPISVAEAERLISTEWQGGPPSQEHFSFMICTLGDGRPIGQALLNINDRRRGQAYFGIFIAAESDRGRGYGTDALNATCDFGFGELRLERISLEVMASNARAIRTYEKAGFRREGLHRNAEIVDGEYVDVLSMALLVEEWRALDRPKSWELESA